MYILKYAKIDLIKNRQFAWLLLFPLLAVLMLCFSSDAVPAFAMTYCQFAGIMASGLPFSCENLTENGFLLMLPSHPGDDIRGHFLFAFGAQIVASLLGMCSILIAGLFRPALGIGTPSLYLLMFGIALLVIALQNILLCIFRHESVQVMQLMRMIPGFLFFFGGNYLLEKTPELIMGFYRWMTLPRIVGICGVCCILYLLLTQLCVALVRHRDN